MHDKLLASLRGGRFEIGQYCAALIHYWRRLANIEVRILARLQIYYERARPALKFDLVLHAAEQTIVRDSRGRYQAAHECAGVQRPYHEITVLSVDRMTCNGDRRRVTVCWRRTRFVIKPVAARAHLGEW